MVLSATPAEQHSVYRPSANRHGGELTDAEERGVTAGPEGSTVDATGQDGVGLHCSHCDRGSKEENVLGWSGMLGIQC